MMEQNIKFKRNLVKRSETTLGINLPKERIDFISGKEGSEITIMPDVNKKGQKYIALYIENEI